MASEPDKPAATASQLPPDLPPEVIAFLNEVNYLDPDRLQVGDRIPPLALTDLKSGEILWLGKEKRSRPLALIFGSYT